MHFIDLLILVAYMVVMLGVGVYILRKNKGADDYYVGGRQMGPWHVGLSVVATDVGGGFTSSQILAGAKLASATFVDLDLMTALWIMGGIAIIYTVMGGIKAVIYTDTVQWILLMGGLILIGILSAIILFAAVNKAVYTTEKE